MMFSAASQSVSDEVRAEEVAAVFRTVTFGTVAALVASFFLVMTLVRIGSTSVTRGAMVEVYFGCMVLMHVSLRHAYMRDAARASDWRRWGLAFTAVALLEGLGWGWTSFGLVPDADFEAGLVCLLVACGVGVGSIPAFGPHFPAFLALFVPATVPFAIHNALSRQPLQQGTAVLMLVYLVAMGMYGIFANRSFRHLVGLRMHAEKLASDLRDQIEIANAANRAKSSFLAAASHDLRQPVHALGLFVGALRGMSMPADALRILERIEASTQALDSLFSALLDISRLDAGVVEVNRRAFAIAPMLDRICRDYAREAQDKGVEMRLARCGAILQSDPILVERILRNLVSNAVRHTREGRVSVGCRRGGGVVRVEVWDTGQGIPPEQREQIFQEYYQLGNAERDRAKGLGLGLAIVRRLTKLLDCDLTVRSKPGLGSCFAITVPLAGVAVGDEETADPELQTQLPPMQRHLIVVVDDELDIRVAMSTLLERWGHHVITAECGGTAIEKLSACPTRPDLIICDFRLRQSETGLQVIDALRLEYNDAIPAILITGDTAPERLIEARDSGLLILHKPVSNSRLRAAITNTLAASAA